MTKEAAVKKISQLMTELIAKHKQGLISDAVFDVAYAKLTDAMYNINIAGKDPDSYMAEVDSIEKSTQNAKPSMTPEEYNAAKKQKYQDYKAGKITNYAYIQWKKQNNPANQPKSGAVSPSASKQAQTPAPKAQAAKTAGNAGKTAEEILGISIPKIIEDVSVYTAPLIDALNNGTITGNQYTAAMKKVVSGSKAWQKQQKEQQPQQTGMTPEEYKAAKSEMYKKYKSGEITNYAYIQWKKQNDPSKQPQTGPVSAPAGKGGTSTGTGKQTATNVDAAYEKLINDVNYQATAGLHDYDEANALIEMLDYLKASGVDPKQAQNQLDSALQLMDLNGFTVEEAMNTAAGFKTGMKPEPPIQTGETGITQEQVSGLLKQLSDKAAAGELTYDAFDDAMNKLYAMKAQGATFEAAQTAVGLDPGTLAAEKAVEKLEKDFESVYAQAAQELKEKLWKIQPEESKKLMALQKAFNNGEITKEEYQKAFKKLTLESTNLKEKINLCAGVMNNANRIAMAMVNDAKVGVFADNANFESYQITKDAGMNLSFAIYDQETVNKLIKDRPELLPRKEVDGKKDVAWNVEKISNAVVQAVIQGESIPKLARRIANETASTNMNAMIRYARTAMTSAQNSGRMETLHRAKGMGISCKKCWLATLDSRTRDAHAKLDGQVVEVDEPFKSEFGDIMYPGDMGSSGSVPGNLYNCRCTLTYEYDGFPADPTANDRIMYEEYTTVETDENGKQKKVFHRESKLITDMTYTEWKAAKQNDELNNLNVAKVQLAEAQKALIAKKVSETKVYKDIWKDPVTLADYQAKKDGIAAKRDYYTAEIEKYEQAKAAGASWATDEKIKELEKKRKLLNEFETNGKLIEKRDKALKQVQEIYNKVGVQKAAAAPAVYQPKAAKKAKKDTSGESTVGATGAVAGASTAIKGPYNPFDPGAYTKDRKDKALWTMDQRKVDNMMRKRTGEVWRKASEDEKDAIFEYTQSYSKFNEPLRGIEYGTNRYLGVGKTDLNAGHKRNGNWLNKMTDIIDKCSYDHDMWLQRGVNFGGMDKFLQCDMSLLQRGTEKQLQNALLGKTITEYGFMSMGSSKGKGFDGNILFNIYAPAGTKMMFVEPFSYYGRNKHGSMNRSEGREWDGKSTQPSYGSEFETIMQQGTQFRITKVEKTNGQIYIDIEVINQDNQQRWKGR